MSMTIVAAEPGTEGLPALLAGIHEESATVAYAHIFDTPFPREETLARWAEFRGSVALARVGEDVVGFVAWDGDHLDALYVLPTAAGTGAGRALIEAAAGTSRLWVLEHNAHARAFYERRGWRPSGRSRCRYGDAVELEYVRPAPVQERPARHVPSRAGDPPSDSPHDGPPVG